MKFTLKRENIKYSTHVVQHYNTNKQFAIFVWDCIKEQSQAMKSNGVFDIPSELNIPIHKKLELTSKIENDTVHLQIRFEIID